MATPEYAASAICESVERIRSILANLDRPVTEIQNKELQVKYQDLLHSADKDICKLLEIARQPPTPFTELTSSLISFKDAIGTLHQELSVPAQETVKGSNEVPEETAAPHESKMREFYGLVAFKIDSRPSF
jgi:hypothetical protein